LLQKSEVNKIHRFLSHLHHFLPKPLFVSLACSQSVFFGTIKQ